MTLVGLLRHGEVAGGTCFRGSRDDPLTASGWAQMQAATTNNPRWDQVVTSPLIRCAGFANTFARQHSLPLTVDERIREIHFGTWEGRTAADLMVEDADALARFWADPAGHPPLDSEPLERFQGRVLAAWDSIIKRYAGQRVLLVTHGGVIRVLLGHVRRRPIGELLQTEVEHGALYSFEVAVDATASPTTTQIVRA